MMIGTCDWSVANGAAFKSLPSIVKQTRAMRPDTTCHEDCSEASNTSMCMLQMCSDIFPSVDGPCEASAGNGRLFLLDRGQRVGRQTETCSKCIDIPESRWPAIEALQMVQPVWQDTSCQEDCSETNNTSMCIMCIDMHWHALTCIDNTHLGRETSDEIAKGCQGLQSLAWCQKKRGNAKSWIIALLENSCAGFVSPPKMVDR